MPTSQLDPGLTLRAGDPRLARAADVIKCLGHPLRLRLLDAMAGGEWSVSDLQERTGASQVTVSQQLAVLRGHGAVSARRDGTFVYYRIADDHVRAIIGCVRRVVGGADSEAISTGRTS